MRCPMLLHTIEDAQDLLLDQLNAIHDEKPD